MENNYICKYGLYHDKPVEGGEPRSNNGWIYTAYANALGHVIKDKIHYEDLQLDCQVNRDSFIANRLPNKQEPPISRDEVIGMAHLKTNVIMSLWLTGFHMTRLDYDNISYLDSIKALWKIRKEHRNYMWINKIKAAYKISFQLMPHDVYYIQKQYQLKTSIFGWLFFQLYAFNGILQPSRYINYVLNNLLSIIRFPFRKRFMYHSFEELRFSELNVLWLQLEDLGSCFWINFIDQPKNFKEYFGEEHIFTRGK